MLLVLFLPQPPVTCHNICLDQRAFFPLSAPPPPPRQPWLSRPSWSGKEFRQPFVLTLGVWGWGDTRVKFTFLPFEEIRPLLSFQSGEGGGGLLIVMLHCAWRVLLRKLFNFNLLLRSHPAPAQGCGGDIIRCETD